MDKLAQLVEERYLTLIYAGPMSLSAP
jgi:hypothetical protein